MKTISRAVRKYGLTCGKAWLICALAWCAAARAQDTQVTTTNAPVVAATNNADADKAWREVRRAQTVMPPPEWSDTKPSPQEVMAFYDTAAVKGADKAKAFYTRYPEHPKAADAHKMEYNLIALAVGRFGDTNQAGRLAELQTQLLKNPGLGDDERFNIRLGIVQQMLQQPQPDMDKVLKDARALQKEFPKRPEAYALLMAVALSGDADTAREIAQDVVDADAAPDDVKEQARGLLNRLGAVGKPVDIEYTAVDGRQVDLAKLKGKVVMIDFWATWCPPCVHEVPNVKAAYDKLHDQGFEVVGISLDTDKDALNTFVSNHGMAWPQYFDGLQWQNKYARKFGIDSIPAMWLVDKQGILRDVDGRDDLENKVSKLLAEKPSSAATVP